MFNQYIAILGTFLVALSGFTYFLDTIRGKNKPNKVTYFLWGLIPLIAFAAEIVQGVGWISLVTFFAGFWSMSIFVVSFIKRESQWKITSFDLICGSISILGAILWLLTRTGNIAIVFSIVADFMAALPTVIKSYNYPETESAWPYFIESVGATLTIVTISSWKFENYAFPIYMVAITFPIFLFAQFKIKKKLSHH